MRREGCRIVEFVVWCTMVSYLKPMSCGTMSFRLKLQCIAMATFSSLTCLLNAIFAKYISNADIHIHMLFTTGISSMLKTAKITSALKADIEYWNTFVFTCLSCIIRRPM